MHNVTSLSASRHLPTAAPQQSSNVITASRALATGVNPAVLRAVANWNEQQGYNKRRRDERARHRAQAVALRQVADEIDWGASVGRAA